MVDFDASSNGSRKKKRALDLFQKDDRILKRIRAEPKSSLHVFVAFVKMLVSSRPWIHSQHSRGDWRGHQLWKHTTRLVQSAVVHVPVMWWLSCWRSSKSERRRPLTSATFSSWWRSDDELCINSAGYSLWLTTHGIGWAWQEIVPFNMQHNAEVACSSEKTSRKPEVDSTEATLAALRFAEDAIDLLCEVEKVQTSTRPCLQAGD